MIEGLATDSRVSIDTAKLAVAEAALDAGAAMVNDITALRADPEIAALCADREAELVLMHMQGSPRTMQENPSMTTSSTTSKRFWPNGWSSPSAQGVAEERIWLDPGIGFGKTVEHNLELLRRLRELTELGRPLVVGTSRKSFIGKLSGAEVDQRLGGTIASCALAFANGARMLRVHDVREVGRGCGSRRRSSPPARSRPGARSRPLGGRDQLPVGGEDRGAAGCLRRSWWKGQPTVT